MNLYGFWNNNTFLTKSGDMATVLKVEGIDYESLDKRTQALSVKHLEAALKFFGPDYRIYQYLFKQNNPEIPFQTYGDELIDAAVEQRRKFFESKADSLYQIDIYYVVIYETKRARTGIWKALSHLINDPKRSIEELKGLFTGSRMTNLLKEELSLDAAKLHQRVSAFIRHLQQDTAIEILNSDQQFTFLRRLVNYDDFRIVGRPKSSQYLDYQIVNSNIEAERDHLRVGDHFVRVLTMKEAISETRPMVLDKLLKLDANFMVCIEWHALSQADGKKMVESRRRHSNAAKGGLSMAKDKPSQRDDLIDEGQQADVEQMGLVLRHLSDGESLGEMSLTVVLSSKSFVDLENEASKFATIIANADGVLFPETYNLINAYLAIVPGNSVHNLRRLLILNSNYADVSFLFTILTGDKRNDHLNCEYLAVLETDNKTPYYLNLHNGEIAHTLILGMTGSGKSFLCNFLLNSTQKLKPLTYIFDIGGSFKSLTEMYHGTYINVGQESKDFHINPFCLEPNEQNLEFLFSFFRVLIEGNKKYELTLEDEKQLWLAIKNTYTVQKQNRTMSTFANLIGQLKPRLARWTNGGQYGWLFDNAEDSLTFSQFQTFNFQGWGDASDVLAALLFYVLHRANNEIVDIAKTATFKTFLLDEAWLFLGNETIRNYVTKAQKTWRKHNAAMIMATQNIEDLQKSGMLGLVSTSCPTKIFLANPDMDRELYADAFHLNDTEIELIAGLIPPGEMVIRRARSSKKVRLEVDSVSYWMATNNAKDNVKKYEYFNRFGIAQGIKQLAIDHPFRPHGVVAMPTPKPATQPVHAS
jgi:type IV secretion system protein VirB4